MNAGVHIGTVVYSNTNSASSASLSVTTTGINRGVLVMVSTLDNTLSSGGTPTAITLNSNAADHSTIKQTTSQFAGAYYFANPALGTLTVSVTFGITLDNIKLTAIPLQNCGLGDATDGTGSWNANAANPSDSITTTATNTTLFDVLSSANTSPTVGTGQTQLENNSTNPSGIPLTQAVSFKLFASAGSSTMSWTATSSQYAYVIVGIKQATPTVKTQTGILRIANKTNAYSTAVTTDSPISYWRAFHSTSILEDVMMYRDGATVGDGYTIESPGAIAADTENTAIFTPAKPGFTTGAQVSGSTSDSYDRGGTTQDWSFEVWIRANSTTANNVAVPSPWTGSGNGLILNKIGGREFSLNQYGSSLVAGFSNYFTNTDMQITATSIFTNTTSFHHVVVTVNRTSQLITLYVDGVSKGTKSMGSDFPSLGDGSFTFGGAVDVAMDEIAFYPTALSGARVIAHYNASFATTTKTQTGLTRITAVTTQTQTGKTRVTATTTKTQTGVTRVTAATVKTQTGITRITATTQRTQTGVTRITAITTKTQLGKADIAKSGVQRTQTGITRITAITTKVQTGITRISQTIAKTQTGLANIYNPSFTATQKSQTGKADIFKANVQQVQTGVTRVSITSTKTQTGKTRITITTAKTQTGKTAIIKVSTQNQFGKANIAGSTVQIQRGVARVALPTSARSLYTNKVIGQATWVSPDPSNPTSYQ